MATKTKEPPKTEPQFSQGTKMRIVTYYPDGERIDRLVEQATELRIGPKELMPGLPLTLEFNLRTKDDVEGMMDYILKLKGDLPLAAPGEKKVKTKKLDAMLSEKEPLEDLLKQAKIKAKDQESLMEFLRGYDFRFIASDVILDNAVDNPGQLELLEKHHDYQFMVRLIKEAKDPVNDKYDYRLVFGIKIVGDRVDKVQVYLWGKYYKTWAVEWKSKQDINFKKVEQVYIFPNFMDLLDRKKWRKENRQKLAAEAKGEEFKPSKFYLKYSPYIKVH